MNKIIIFAVLYFLFLSNFSLKVRFKAFKYQINYNGLLWVCLDRYSIWKYKSNDIPLKMFEVEKILKINTRYQQGFQRNI